MKEKFIEVYDNFLSSDLTNNFENVFFDKKESFPKLQFKSISQLTETEENKNNPDSGYGNDFYFDNKYLNEATYLLQPFYSFCSFANINPLFIIKARYFVQPPRGKIEIAPPHIDIDWPHWVFLYYVNDSDGDTIFYNEKKEIIKKVTPKKGRVAFFDGSIYHSASTPSVDFRAVININFVGKLWK